MRAFQVGDRYEHGTDGKRKDWIDDGRIWRKADEPGGGDGGDARDRESARWRL